MQEHQDRVSKGVHGDDDDHHDDDDDDWWNDKYEDDDDSDYNAADLSRASSAARPLLQGVPWTAR